MLYTRGYEDGWSDCLEVQAKRTAHEPCGEHSVEGGLFMLLRGIREHADAAKAWDSIDVDTRNAITSSWRRTLRYEVETHLQRPAPPPSTGQYTEGDVITFLGYLSADLPELHNVEMQRFHDAWDEYLRRIGRAAETKNSEHPIDCMQCEIHGKGE